MERKTKSIRQAWAERVKKPPAPLSAETGKKVCSPKISEHDIQKAFFQWLETSLYRPYVFAIPNGGKRHIGVARKLKAEGVMAGVFDVFMAIPTEQYHGLWIEFKAGKNKLTPNQAVFMRRMSLNDYYCVVCYSAEQAIEAFERYLAGEESAITPKDIYLKQARESLNAQLRSIPR